MRHAVLVVVVACSSPAPRPQAASPLTQHVTDQLDVLFVIGGTADKQAMLASNFPQLVHALGAFPGGTPDLHLAVVDTTVDIGVAGFAGCPSPDPSDDGLFQNTARVAGCSPPTGRYIVDGATTNYSGTLQDTFSCIAQVGAGCAFEEPLEAMKRALDGSRPENAGFLRDDADLAIVILADEDDCSADPALFGLTDAGAGDFRCTAYGYACDQPISTTSGGTYTNCAPRTDSYLIDPARYYDFLATVKDPSRIALAVIGGDASTTIMTSTIQQTLLLEPSCSTSTGGIAQPGIRLADLVARFGERGRFSSACQSDYGGALGSIGELVYALAGPCVAGAIDTTDHDTRNPGLQPACTVSIYDPTTGTGVVVPPCRMLDADTPDPSDGTCAYFTPDTSCTTTPSGLAVHVFAAPEPFFDVSCLAAP